MGDEVVANFDCKSDRNKDEATVIGRSKLPPILSRSSVLVAYCLCLALAGSGYPTRSPRAQTEFFCGNLHLQAIPDPLVPRGSSFLSKVVLRSDGSEPRVLGGSSIPTVDHPPSARCLATSVLVIAFFALAGPPTALLVFPDGQLLWTSGEYLEFRGDGTIVIPQRPRLPLAARERIPTQHRDLFDYHVP